METLWFDSPPKQGLTSNDLDDAVKIRAGSVDLSGLSGVLSSVCIVVGVLTASTLVASPLISFPLSLVLALILHESVLAWSGIAWTHHPKTCRV